MPWSEFTSLLAGIMPKTPLGQIVSIRSENDKEVLKYFTKEQHKIRNAWRTKRTVQFNKEDAEKQIIAFQMMMKRAFSKGCSQ